MTNCNTFPRNSLSQVLRLLQVTLFLSIVSMVAGKSALAETISLSQPVSQKTNILAQSTYSPYPPSTLEARVPMMSAPMPVTPYPMYPVMPGMMPGAYPGYLGGPVAQLKVPSVPATSRSAGQTPPPPAYSAYPMYPAGSMTGVMPIQAPTYPMYPAMPGMVPGAYPSGAGGVPVGAYPMYPPAAMVPMMPFPGYPMYPAMPGMMPGFYPGVPGGMPVGMYPMYPSATMPMMPPGVMPPGAMPPGVMPAMSPTVPGTLPASAPGQPPLAPVYPTPAAPAIPMMATPAAPPATAPLPPLPTVAPLLAQPVPIPAGAPLPAPRQTAAQSLIPGKAITPPFLGLQGAAIYQGDEFSARARVYGRYFLSPNVLVGSTIDLTTGNAFVDTNSEGLNINELYVAANLPNVPNLRFVVGQMDLTSYFDRNSFAKDVTTQFFNNVFQTNPALAQTNVGSRPGALVNWRITDNLDAKAAVYSSSASLSDFNLNAFAGEVGARAGNLIVRGTYASGRNAENGGFPQIFQRNPGPSSDDRIEAYGFNAEVFIPEIKLGIFGRYGWYNNLTLDASAYTYSFGVNALDLFLPNDRLGVGYGQQLSSRSGLDVFEVFYDLPVYQNLRLGFSFQGLDGFSETILGVRVKADLDITPAIRTQ